MSDYAAKFARMCDASLEWSLRDINETLKIWQGEDAPHPYVAKLYCEWDAVLAEIRNRFNKREGK